MHTGTVTISSIKKNTKANAAVLKLILQKAYIYIYTLQRIKTKNISKLLVEFSDRVSSWILFRTVCWTRWHNIHHDCLSDDALLILAMPSPMLFTHKYTAVCLTNLCHRLFYSSTYTYKTITAHMSCIHPINKLSKKNINFCTNCSIKWIRLLLVYTLRAWTIETLTT